MRHLRSGFFTVDVEDWYHALLKDPLTWGSQEDRIVAPTSRLLELLASTQNRATFFVLGDVAERHPDLVDAILQGGHEVGCHGYDHRPLTDLDATTFAKDVRRSLAALRSAGAGHVVSYRAPYFSLHPRNPWALQVLADEGIRIDSSVCSWRAGNRGTGSTLAGPHQRGALLEVPISFPVLGGVRLPLNGGFYGRFFPRWLGRWGMRRLFAGADPPVYYVHPWELDPAQPRIPVGPSLRFRHYLRLECTEAIVEELLAEYRWRPLADLLRPDAPSLPSPVRAS